MGVLHEIQGRWNSWYVYGAKGYTQSYDIDYWEKFSPVVKLNTTRALLSIAAILDWPQH